MAALANAIAPSLCRLSLSKNRKRRKQLLLVGLLSASAIASLLILSFPDQTPRAANILRRNRISDVPLEQQFRFLLSACVIVRQSSDIMPEFIVRNYAAGVDHFYIYGDDDDDQDEIARLRRLFAIFDGIVTYVADGRNAPRDEEDPESYVQMRMYRHCIEEHGSTSKWITLIDTDEFFETYALPLLESDPTKRPRKAFIHDVLSSHEAFPVLCVRWRSALTNGRQLSARPGEFLFDMFPETCKISMVDNGKLAYKKTILQTRYVDMEESPKLDDAIHKGFSFKGPGAHTNMSCKEDLGKHMEPPIHIVHYWSRDLSSYLRKIVRGRPRKTVPARTLTDLLMRERMCEPEGILSSARIRHDYLKKLLARFPMFRPKSNELPSARVTLGLDAEPASSPKQGESIQFCVRHVEKLLSELSKGRALSNFRYCRDRASSACSVYEEDKPMRWPFPWVEYVTNCEEADEAKFFK